MIRKFGDLGCDEKHVCASGDLTLRLNYNHLEIIFKYVASEAPPHSSDSAVLEICCSFLCLRSHAGDFDGGQLGTTDLETWAYPTGLPHPVKPL